MDDFPNKYNKEPRPVRQRDRGSTPLCCLRYERVENDKDHSEKTRQWMPISK